LWLCAGVITTLHNPRVQGWTDLFFMRVQSSYLVSAPVQQMLGSGCCIFSAAFDAFMGDVGATATRQPGRGQRVSVCPHPVGWLPEIVPENEGLNQARN